MKCPKCHTPMKKIQWSVHNNGKANTAEYKEYGRTLYVCKGDDIWVTVEVPTSSQLTSEA